MEFAETSDCPSIPPEFGAARGVLPRFRRPFAHMQTGRQTLGCAFQLEDSCLPGKERGHQMLTFFRLGIGLMDLVADFEYAEFVEVLRVIHDVAMDARQQRSPQ